MIGVVCFALFTGTACVVAAAKAYGNHDSLRKPVIRPFERQRWERLWIAGEDTPGNLGGHKR